jgi:hypothetical protein
LASIVLSAASNKSAEGKITDPSLLAYSLPLLMTLFSLRNAWSVSFELSNIFFFIGEVSERPAMRLVQRLVSLLQSLAEKFIWFFFGPWLLSYSCRLYSVIIQKNFPASNFSFQ